MSTVPQTPESPDLSETRQEDAIMRLVDELASAARDAGWWASAPHMANAVTAAEKRRTTLREQIQSALTAARAEREKDRQLIQAYRDKRAADGLNGRMWDAMRHLEAERDVQSLEGQRDA